MIFNYTKHTFTDWIDVSPAGANTKTLTRSCTICGREETKVMDITFEVKFVDYDGTVLEVVTVKKGETPQYSLSTPVREADSNYIYKFEGWDSELIETTEDKIYTAVYTTVEKTSNGQLVWDEENINYSLVSDDYYAGLYSPELNVVEIDGKNALQLKYKDGFFDLAEQNKTTPGITFVNDNKFNLTENSVVTFYVRASEVWNYSNNGGGIYIFYNGEVCGTISTTGTLWDSASNPTDNTRDRYINKSLVTVTNIFANGTISEKDWVEVTITFEGIENPSLENLTIAYGCMHGTNFSGLLSTEKNQVNSWIYISDLTITTEE